MAFVQNLGAKINPYASLLPRGMQQSAQQQAGRQFLGGLAAPFLAAAGPSRYPMPTVAGLAGVNPAIQSAQQTQNVALQNAMNAQKLQMFQQQQNILASLSPPQPTPRPPVNLAPTAPLTIPTDMQSVPATLTTNAVNKSGPSMAAYNTAMKQPIGTPYPRAGVPAAATPQSGAAAPGGTFNMLSGRMTQNNPPTPDYRRIGMRLILAGDPVRGKAIMEMGKGTTAMQNAAAMGLRPGTPEYNQHMQNVTNPAARFEPKYYVRSTDMNMDQISAMNEGMTRAGQTNRLLETQKRLFESQPPEAFGPGSELLQNTKDLFNAYGFTGLANRLGATPGSEVAKVLSGIATEITFDTTGKLKGAISEKEIALAGQVASRITDTKNAALANIEIRMAMNDKEMQIARAINMRMRSLTPSQRQQLISSDPQAITLMVEAESKKIDILPKIDAILKKYTPVAANSQEPIVKRSGNTGSGN